MPQILNLRSVAVRKVSQIAFYLGAFFLRCHSLLVSAISKRGYISFVVYVYIYTGVKKKKSNGPKTKECFAFKGTRCLGSVELVSEKRL